MDTKEQAKACYANMKKSSVPCIPTKIPQAPKDPPRIPHVPKIPKVGGDSVPQVGGSKVPSVPSRSASHVRGTSSTRMAANILAKTSLAKGAINDAVCKARNKAKIPAGTDLRKLGFPGIPKDPQGSPRIPKQS